MGNTRLDADSIKGPASIEQWDTFIDFAVEKIENKFLDNSRSYKLKLAFEELLSNIIKAAEDPDNDNPISTTLEVKTSERFEKGRRFFVLQTSDNGVRFDPQFESRSPIDTNQDVLDRPIGGLGLFLIIESVDRATYQWKDGHNIYELFMELGV